MEEVGGTTDHRPLPRVKQPETQTASAVTEAVADSVHFVDRPSVVERKGLEPSTS
jgi:hypothetical protein